MCEPSSDTTNAAAESDLVRGHSDVQQTPRPAESSPSDGGDRTLPGQNQLEKEAHVHDRRPRSQQRGYRREDARHSGYKKEDGGYKSEHSRRRFEHRQEKQSRSLPDGARRGELEEETEGCMDGLEVGGSELRSGRSKPHPQPHPQQYNRQYHGSAGYGRYYERHRQSKAATKRDYGIGSSSDAKGKNSKSGDDRVCREEREQEMCEELDRDEAGSRVPSDERAPREREKGDRRDRKREYRGKEPANEKVGRTSHKKGPPTSKERGYKGEIDSKERGYKGETNSKERGYKGEIDSKERGYKGETDSRERGYKGEIDLRERVRGDAKGGMKLMRRDEQGRSDGRGKMEGRTASRKIRGGNGDTETEKAVKGKEAGENVAEQTGDGEDVTRNGDGEKELERTDDRDTGRSTQTSDKKTEQHRKPVDFRDKTESGKKKKPPSSRVSSSTRPQSSIAKPRGKKVIPTVQSDELAQQLTAGTYECMVCCERVGLRDHVWSCSGCYHVFHLRCIKKWARSPAAGVVVVVEEGDSAPEGWRCPGCRKLSTVVPSVYKCYCGKVNHPRPKSQGELTVPHSCGELCLKKLAATPESSCKHKCRLPCHPGPCPPCPVMVTRSCPCGTKVYHVRCSRVSELASCGAVCRRKLLCGRHYCGEKCHSGPCPSCSVLLTQSCHCGRSSREERCGEVRGTAFSCGHTCERELDCGNHLCEQPCHEGTCLSCPLLPSNVTACPCGATPLSELLPGGVSRTSCLDPVPTCSKTCGRRLLCSTPDNPHHCPAPCHEGECPPCDKSTSVRCQCGRASVRVACVEVEGMGGYQCQHVCNKKKSCGRHRCNVRCCTDLEHFCDLKCGKRLQCGLHCCQEKCHSGYCGQCWEYSYEELMCHCGAEVMYPPIPCGTRPPTCSRLCARMHPCQHPVSHTCHNDEECPPCTFLTEKMCMGGHELRRNIPCHITDVSCGSTCSKPLPCGAHKCQRVCHRGACLDRAEDCKQPCTTARKFCSHACAHPCHVGEPCPDTPCKALVSLSCPCQRRSEKVPCLASSSGAMHQAFQKLLSKDLGAKIRDLQSGQSVTISSITTSSNSGERYLECDEVCAQEARNRRLAAALDIDNPVINPLASSEGHYSYSPFLMQEARSDFQFVASVDEALKSLVEAALKSSSAPTRSHSFRPMKSNQRRVIHELAAHYGCDTVSYDPEPQRNVVITANKSRARLPPLSLTKLVERERYKLPPAPVNVMAVSEKGDATSFGDLAAADEGSEKVPDYFADDFSV